MDTLRRVIMWIHYLTILSILAGMIPSPWTRCDTVPTIISDYLIRFTVQGRATMADVFRF
jgi:hypothetical protein